MTSAPPDVFDVPGIFLPEYIALHGRNQPDRAAVICCEEQVSWREFAGRLDRVAAALAAGGVGRGGKVGILTDNSIAGVEAYFGTLRAGAAVASLSTIVADDALARMIDDSGSRTVIASAPHQRRIDAMRSRLARVPEGGYVGIGAAGPGWQRFDHWRDGATGPAPHVPIGPDDDACLIYSSGTTGLPKGIALSHFCRLNHGLLMGSAMRFAADSIVLVTTALYSNTAWTLFLCGFIPGATVVVMPKFDAAEWCRLVERWRVTHTIMVPTQFQMILESPELARRDVGSLRTLCTVGSLMREQMKRDISARFRCGLYEVYGLTEGFATLLRPDDSPAKWGSVGRAMLGNDLRVIDDQGRELPWGEAGEIVGYSPILMRGYHNRPAETARAIWREPRSGRTFLRSGDIGRFDAEGYFYLLDRKKDMIVSGGYNVFPADLERVVGGHAEVEDVCVIGIPHEKWGETPLALVVPRSGASIDAEELRQWANQRLGKHQRLARVEFRTGLPRNAGGKVLKRELRAPYWPENANA
jgi:acyl-CoA synthetase (AMP-forming)/AMP-acid ligase II